MGDEDLYLPKWEAVGFMKLQNNRNCMKGNNQIWFTIGQVQAFTSFC